MVIGVRGFRKVQTVADDGSCQLHVPARFTRCDRRPVAVRLFGQHARPQDAPDSLAIWIGVLPGDEAALERMQVSESIQCPFCGQDFELVIDTSIESQRFTTDCEVCCRPFEVFAECEPGEVVSLEVQGG